MAFIDSYELQCFSKVSLVFSLSTSGWKTSNSLLFVCPQDDILTVIRRVDENWAEGMLGDKIGIFPISYVEVSHMSALKESFLN